MFILIYQYQKNLFPLPALLGLLTLPADLLLFLALGLGTALTFLIPAYLI